MPSDNAMLAMLRLHLSIRHLLIRADADHAQLIRSSCSGVLQRIAARFAAASPQAVMPSSHPHGSEPIVLREGNDQTILQPPGLGLTARLLLGLLLRPGHPQLHPSSPAPPQCTPSIFPGTLLASQAVAVAPVLYNSHRPEVRDDLAQSLVLNPKLGGFLAILLRSPVADNGPRFAHLSVNVRDAEDPVPLLLSGQRVLPRQATLAVRWRGLNPSNRGRRHGCTSHRGSRHGCRVHHRHCLSRRRHDVGGRHRVHILCRGSRPVVEAKGRQHLFLRGALHEHRRQRRHGRGRARGDGRRPGRAHGRLLLSSSILQHRQRRRCRARRRWRRQ
mmetsp:Transcript_158893/g.509619  ORF Transcript_158893/g.509619 Transcript_158893/m.509619 type:complete len:331 (-) Transcript_158893:889-1881(-)